MNPETDQFVILATDGLWDVMTSEEAVQYVHTVMGGAMGALREGDLGHGRGPDGAAASGSDRPGTGLQLWGTKGSCLLLYITYKCRES